MKKIMRTRQNASIVEFKGVDLTSPLLNVSDSRATNISNFIKKNGVNQKRKGWEEIGKVGEFKYYEKQTINDIETDVEVTNGNTIHNIWEFIGEDGVTHIIAHIGKVLFKVENIGKDKTFYDCTFTPIYTSTTIDGTVYKYIKPLLDEDVMAFNSGGRLYILGGIKYLMLRFYTNDSNVNVCELVEVEDNDLTYIPTTSIAITCKDSPLQVRKQLDDVNLMSTKRKNKLLSHTLLENDNIVRTTRFYEYELDSNINTGGGHSIDDVTIELNYSKEAE